MHIIYLSMFSHIFFIVDCIALQQTGVISTPKYDLVIRPLHEHHAQRFRREAEMRAPEDDTLFARNAARSLSSDPLHIVIKRDAQYPDDRDTESGNDTVVTGDDDDMQEHFCGLDSSRWSMFQ